MIIENYKDEVKRHPELQNVLRSLLKEEREELEKGILEQGRATVPVQIWNGFLVDGHNRVEICEEHGLPFSVDVMEFADIEKVKQWMCRQQLGRRNNTQNDRTYLLGELYKSRVKSQELEEKPKYDPKAGDPLGQIFPKPEPEEVDMDAAHAEAVEEMVDEEVKQQAEGDFGIAISDIVRTSYKTGPYRTVKIIGFDDDAFSLTLVDLDAVPNKSGGYRENQYYYLNGYKNVGGRYLNDDGEELFVGKPKAENPGISVIPERTREAVAKEVNVSPATVARAAKVHTALEDIDNPEVTEAFRAGEITQKAVLEQVKKEPEPEKVEFAEGKDEVTVIIANQAKRLDLALTEFKKKIASITGSGMESLATVPGPLAVFNNGLIAKIRIIENDINELKDYFICQICSGTNCNMCANGYVSATGYKWQRTQKKTAPPLSFEEEIEVDGEVIDDLEADAEQPENLDEKCDFCHTYLATIDQPGGKRACGSCDEKIRKEVK